MAMMPRAATSQIHPAAVADMTRHARIDRVGDEIDRKQQQPQGECADAEQESPSVALANPVSARSILGDGNEDRVGSGTQ